ncbi:MAG: DUF559 domain-containing protein [Candidatus Gracilibacteria bacterium]|nr:DUF559 domain-containing protein [Candidatus Gracilibacteria bacterium]
MEKAYSPKYVLELAKELRKNGTKSEEILWEILRNNQLGGLKFRRQHPIGRYIADFFCYELGLVIELDGSIHENLARKEYDEIRNDFMNNGNYKILRIKNDEILNKTESTINKILKYTILPSLSGRGVGGEGTFITPFRELLNKIDKLEGLDRIRFTSSNPHDMTRDILDAHFELNKTCNYLHFALQSGDDEILKKMNRKHTYSDFKSQVEYLRSRDPLFSISTDIIVGFPGETEANFENTVKAMMEIEFDFAYIARYSSRPGTYADKNMQDSVPYSIKAKRWHILNDILGKSVKKRSELFIGKTEEILISGISNSGKMYGRTRGFREVFFDKDEKLKIGDIVMVKIERLNKWIFEGKIVD